MFMNLLYPLLGSSLFGVACERDAVRCAVHVPNALTQQLGRFRHIPAVQQHVSVLHARSREHARGGKRVKPPPKTLYLIQDVHVLRLNLQSSIEEPRGQLRLKGVCERRLSKGLSDSSLRYPSISEPVS
jgi:hypothetical protein